MDAPKARGMGRGESEIGEEKESGITEHGTSEKLSDHRTQGMGTKRTDLMKINDNTSTSCSPFLSAPLWIRFLSFRVPRCFRFFHFRRWTATSITTQNGPEEFGHIGDKRSCRVAENDLRSSQRAYPGSGHGKYGPKEFSITDVFDILFEEFSLRNRFSTG